MREIDRDQVKRMIDTDPDAILVEVLDEKEFMKGHLPKAVNLPLTPDFEDKIADIVSSRKQRPVIVYGKNSQCSASSEAADRMEKLGYSNVLDFKGGKDDWISAELPMIVPQ